MNLERAKLCMEYCVGLSDEQIKSDIYQGWTVIDYIQSDYDAGVAAGMTKAAEICRKNKSVNGKYVAAKILSTIPAESKAALREVCMKVAFHSAKFGAMHGAGINMNGLDSTDLESIVNSVLEGKS